MIRGLAEDLANDPLDKEQDEMTGRVRDSVIDNFNDEVDYDGATWEPRKRDYDHDPLRETFAMFGAATVKGAPGSIEVKSREEVVMGVSTDEIEYAAAQNYGHDESNLPAREYMFIREEHQSKLDEVALDGIGRVVDESIEKHSR